MPSQCELLGFAGQSEKRFAGFSTEMSHRGKSNAHSVILFKKALFNKKFRRYTHMIKQEPALCKQQSPLRPEVTPY